MKLFPLKLFPLNSNWNYSNLKIIFSKLSSNDVQHCNNHPRNVRPQIFPIEYTYSRFGEKSPRRYSVRSIVNFPHLPFITDNFTKVSDKVCRILRGRQLFSLPGTISLIDCFCPRRRRPWFFAESDVIQFSSLQLVRAKSRADWTGATLLTTKRRNKCIGLRSCEALRVAS